MYCVGQYGVSPPSTLIDCPRMITAASDSRNATTRPTSIGWSVASLLEPPRVAAVSGRSATCGGATVIAQPDGTATVEGDLGTQSAQFDALWALCQLSWSGLVTDPDAVLDRLELIP